MYEIEIKAGTNAVIFYTTDGSQPTAQDKRYTEKIKLEKGMHLKAIAICPSGRKSEITDVKL